MTTPSTFKLGYPGLKYSTVPFAGTFQRDPTTADVNSPRVGGPYKAGTIWMNAATGGAWIFTGIVANAAQWRGITDAASGDIIGPATSTDNAIVRFDGTTGKLVQNSLGIVSDVGILTGLRAVLPAGTTVAGTAPLKFTAGTNLTVVEPGAMEFDGEGLYWSGTTGPTRYRVLSIDSGISLTGGTIPIFSAGAKMADSSVSIASGVMTFPAGGGNILTTGGAAARKGTAAFTAGASGTIATTSVAANSAIVVTRTNLAGATAATGYYVTITPGVSFIVTSGDAADTSAFTWAIVG